VRKQLPALLLFGLFAIALVGGGVFVIVRQHSGVPVTVTVTECTTARAAQGGSVCYGSWTVDGRTLTGEIEGSGDASVGDEISARATGTRAYTPSLRLPIILITLGVLLPAGAYWEAARNSARASDVEAATA
jgi:hypothetical protein